MKTKTLCGVVGILIFVWAGAVLAQSENEAINLAKEARTIFDNAKSKEDYQRAAQKYEEALKISETVKSDKWTDICSYQLGLIQSTLGQYPKSLEYFEKSLAIGRKGGDVKGEGTTLNEIGLTYENLGQYAKALDYYEQSLTIRKKIGDVKGEGANLNNIGSVYDSLGQYAKALDYYEQSLTIRKKIGNVKGEGTNLNNIGEVYRIQGRYTKALDYFNQSLVISKKTGDLSGEYTNLNNIGACYERLGRRTKALECFEQSLAICKRIGDVSGEGASLGNIGDTYAQMGKHDDALRAANESLLIKEKTGVPVKGIKDAIANYYLDAGLIDKAEPLINETKDNSTLGRLALMRSDYPLALTYYEMDALEAEKTGNADSLFRSLAGMAKAYEGMENYSKAKEYYEKAIKQVEQISSGLAPSELKNFFEVRIGGFARSDLAKGMYRVRMKLNHPEASMPPSDRTNASWFAYHLLLTKSIGATYSPVRLDGEIATL